MLVIVQLAVLSRAVWKVLENHSLIDDVRMSLLTYQPTFFRANQGEYRPPVDSHLSQP